MKRETIIWTCVLLAGIGALAVRSATVRCGRVFVKGEAYAFVMTKPAPVTGQVAVPVPGAGEEPGPAEVKEEVAWQRLTRDAEGRWVRPGADNPEVVAAAAVERNWMTYTAVPARESLTDPEHVEVSWSRTWAVWIAAGMTLCALSFLWGDNVFFKLMQSIAVGASAGYAFVTGFWTKIVPELLGNLSPALVKAWAVPGHPVTEWNPLYLVPLTLSLMMLCRLSPVGGWISRWPLAFFIGLLAGVNLVNIFKADFIDQVRATILPLLVFGDRGFDLYESFKNLTIVVGVLASLTYFFFSVEHRGAVGKAANVGVWVLMITFGASFGLTVMTRITIFSSRLQFLFDDWLWLIDPLGNRTGLS